MRLPTSLILAALLCVQTLAAPLLQREESKSALELRAARARPKAIAKPKALPKPKPKPVVKPKPVAKPKVVTKPATKPAEKKPAAKPVAKPVAAKKPAVAKPIPKTPVAKKPTAPVKPPVAKKPATKAPVAKQPSGPAKAPVAKEPAAPAKPVAKTPATTTKKTGTAAKAPIKAAPANAPVAKKPPTSKTAAKPPTTAAGAKSAAPKSCAIKKSGAKSKAGVKPRNSDTEGDCEDVCSSFVNGCNECVTTGRSNGLTCAFNKETNTCVTEGATGLLTNVKQCKAAEEEATAAQGVTITDPRIIAAAKKAFSSKVQTHVFVGDKGSKSTSGRHLLSVWTKANRGSVEQARDKTTGVVEFKASTVKTSKKIKTVWNDVAGTGESSDTVIYDRKDLDTLCLRAYGLSIINNGADAKLRAAGTPVSGKGKAKATEPDLPPTAGVAANEGIVVFNAKIEKNVCVHVDANSCYPIGTGTVGGKEGSSCAGDGEIEE